MFSKSPHFFHSWFYCFQVSTKSKDGEDGSDDEDMTEEKNWEKLDGEVIKLTIEQNEYGLGLSLAGRPLTVVSHQIIFKK